MYWSGDSFETRGNPINRAFFGNYTLDFPEIKDSVKRSAQERSASKQLTQKQSTQENKLHYAIGINQRLFKPKHLIDKKISVPKPTERDLLLLEQLESYGVLSTQQIRELVFKGANTRTALRRLRLLKQRGLILSSEGLPNGALAWFLSKKSTLMFKHDVETKVINKNSLQHDVAVSSIRGQLERLLRIFEKNPVKIPSKCILQLKKPLK